MLLHFNIFVKKAPTTSGEEIHEEMEGSIDPPVWCECGKCRMMKKEEECVCCKNCIKNHEHPVFENHVLTEHNLELAMQNNADFLNYPR